MVSRTEPIPTLSAAGTTAVSPVSAPVRSENQAIVIIERRNVRQGDDKTEQLIPGWHWVLGNTFVGDFFDQLFADANLTWASLMVPAEVSNSFGFLSQRIASKSSIVGYDGTLRIQNNQLTHKPDQSQPAYIIVNGDRFPICDLSDAMSVHRQNRADVTLIDFPQRSRKQYNEKIQLERDGSVKRVNRSYEERETTLRNDRDWPSVMIVSADAMKTLLDVALPLRMNQWPAALLRAGLMVRGSTIPGRSFSLFDKEHLYELNEIILRLRPHWLTGVGKLVDQGEKIWIGKNVKIDSTANLLGPIAIGDNVEIGPDAVVVGPTTIGKGSKIGSGIILKRSVVLPNTTLASATLKVHAISQAIVLGGDTPTIQALTTDSDLVAGSSDTRSLSVDRPIRLETVLEGGATPVLTGFRYRSFHFAKRTFDIGCALFALIATSPFYPLAILGILLNDFGPIFYGAVRQGRGGKNFKCWKFRTMYTNADEMKRKLTLQNEVDGPQFKIKNDPRIFPFGKLLRKLNIDELPQFWNVLVGQMSVVGPRPSPEKENQMCPAWREARLSVRPGITGLWQVSRNKDRGETDFQEWIYYDVQYIKKQSFWMDIKIFFRTFRSIFGGH